MAIPVKGLFETHISVKDRQVSKEFYQRVVGLELATEIPARDITFFWVGGHKKQLLGIWGANSPNPPISRGHFHFAFEVELQEFDTIVARLKELDVQPLDFNLKPTDEPVVIGWVPNLSIYFKDPDGHSLEFLAVMPETARPEVGVVNWSEWKKQAA